MSLPGAASPSTSSLLPQANFENSRKVMERIIKAFSRQYPHSPAVLHYSVQPLDPTC